MLHAARAGWGGSCPVQHPQGFKPSLALLAHHNHTPYMADDMRAHAMLVAAACLLPCCCCYCCWPPKGARGGLNPWAAQGLHPARACPERRMADHMHARAHANAHALHCLLLMLMPCTACCLIPVLPDPAADACMHTSGHAPGCPCFLHRHAGQMELQRTDAWFPEALPRLLAEVKRLISSKADCRCATTCIFPECGSGYSEWQVVRVLQGVCRVGVTEVLLMDTHTQENWRGAWAALAAQAGVRLVVQTSYEQLAAWAHGHASCCAPDCLVLYINGSLRFSPSTCPPPCPPGRSKAAAIQFWLWCHAHALNAPANFLLGIPHAPGACVTWSELAEQHTRDLMDTSRSSTVTPPPARG